MNTAVSSENGTGFQLTRAIGRVVNGHTIMMSPVVGGGATITVWLGPTTRLDGWVAGYADVNEAISEARRVRALIERYGSIAAVDRSHSDATAELATCRDRARAAHLNRVADETENLADRAAIRQLINGVTDFLATA